MHDRIYNSSPGVTVPSQMNPFQFILMFVLKLSFHLRLNFPSSLITAGFHTKVIYVCTSLPSHSCHIPHQSRPHSSDHTNEVERSVKVMKFSIMQFSSASYYLLHLRPNSLPYNLSSSILSPYSSLNMTDRFSRTFQTTGNIILF